MYPHEGQVFLLIGGDRLGIHFFLGSKPASQFTVLEFTGFGEHQPSGIHHGSERDRSAIDVQFHDGMAGRFGHRGECTQRGFAACIVVAAERPRNVRILRAGELGQ
jgi:hypothetical protein